MEHAVLYLPSNGTSFICNTTAAAFRLIRRFILPRTVLSLRCLLLLPSKDIKKHFFHF